MTKMYGGWNFEEVRAKTKAAAVINADAAREGYGDIYTAYGAPSKAKVSAWNEIRDLCALLAGWDLKVTGKSCMTFSALFKFVDPETGVIRIAKFTRDHNRVTDSIY